MFYEAKKIDNQLQCKQCEGRLDVPKILPCGETICSFCETSIQVNENNTFDCLICKDKHEMPKNGFLISKALSELSALHDLFISDKSNTNTSSLSNLCNSYIHPEYEYKSNGAKSFLAGSYNFQVLETEVFSK